ncbi:MAG: hypothetical protein K2W95_29955 [Candidatus Obscuribacterales bacterium]|nr:hypothetical protein [Candidatus Obscuribacterales bacterium]
MVIGDVLPTHMASLVYLAKGPRLIHVPYPPYPSLDVARIPPWESVYPAETIPFRAAADESYNVRPLRVFSTDELLRSCAFPVVATIDLHPIV